MGYRKKRWFCSLLAALCLLSALPRMESLARVAVETGRTCTLSITMTLNNPEGDWQDLKNNADVIVDICRVASMDTAGAYTPVEGFSSLNDALKNLNHNTATVDFWKAQAEAAADIFEGLPVSETADISEDQPAPEEEAETPGSQPAPAGRVVKTITIKEGSGKQSGLPVGLYLVYPRTVKTDEYIYTFEPYLVSLPNNYYGAIGANGSAITDDSWDYDNVKVGLKPEQRPRYGDLIIEKALDQHNAALGAAVFVFQVEGVNGKGESVYSNVHALSFTGKGEDTIRIEKLPAGTKVTVTEVYEGSSYEATSSKTQGADGKIVVKANEYYDTPQAETPDGAGTEDIKKNDTDTVTVTFSNKYSDSLTPGSGITNHFTYNGSQQTGEDGTVTWNGRWELEEQIPHKLPGNSSE